MLCPLYLFYFKVMTVSSISTQLSSNETSDRILIIHKYHGIKDVREHILGMIDGALDKNFFSRNLLLFLIHLAPNSLLAHIGHNRYLRVGKVIALCLTSYCLQNPSSRILIFGFPYGR